ncbi:silver efflux pump [Legionella geestiana]|uniref:Silver efflux pump n=1 Tax=Legionella geestiana TaxID=45065 RepID=A0A0W0U790_9GAMM|nr:hypothetical protein [Legionella geestiana]KTD03776.1 silver efflux pump [Legionella geestiana]QBS11938.1 hypothetical protein E4T54_03785 [Legionella geestiana]QDQ40449.1 hypothetical protein E3226_008640 [Legionella geestiana]STX53349.1 silver efflux pump [Legionella geestiana]
MKKVHLTGAALAAGVAALFAATPVLADDAAPAAASTSAPMVMCVGANSCKGQSMCKTATNACKGQNSCKGNGVVPMTQEDCTKAGGTVQTDSSAGTGSTGQ